MSTPDDDREPGAPLPLATWAEGFGLSKADALDEVSSGRLQPMLLPPPERCGQPAIVASDDDVWAWAWVDGASTMWWLMGGSPRALDALAHVAPKHPGLGQHVARLRAETGYGPGRLQ